VGTDVTTGAKCELRTAVGPILLEPNGMKQEIGLRRHSAANISVFVGFGGHGFWNMTFWTILCLSDVQMKLQAKFDENETNGSKVIKILWNLKCLPAAILDCEKWHFWHFRCLGGVRTKLHAKFGDNRTYGSKVIKVLVKSNMAAGGHLGLWISGFWARRSLSGKE